MANDDLHQPLKAINETVARLREDVQKLTGEVKKIKTAITEAAQTVQGAIHENIQAQAELTLMEHLMEVKSVKPQIEAEHEQIRTERSELDERVASIGERYAEKHQKLDQTASERIRELGSHIFEIDEKEFEEDVERPFTERVTTSWQLLQGHNATVGEERSTAVQDTTSEAVQQIYDYVDRQDQLLERIDDHRLDSADAPLPEEEPTQLQVPYYVVRFEHDGVQKTETVVPSKLSTDGTEWCSVSFDDIAGAEDLLQGVGPVDSPETTETISGDRLHDVLGQYGSESALGLSYAETAAETVPDDGAIVAHEVDD